MHSSTLLTVLISTFGVGVYAAAWPDSICPSLGAKACDSTSPKWIVRIFTHFLLLSNSAYLWQIPFIQLTMYIFCP